jgi:outer membrane protein
MSIGAQGVLFRPAKVPVLDGRAGARYGPPMQRALSSRPSGFRAFFGSGGSLIAALVVTVGLLLAPRVASAQMKIAVIDTDRAVFETEEGLRAQATLKKLFDSRQVDLDNKQRTLQQEKDALDKDAAAGKVPKADLQKKAETLQKQFVELQQVYVDYQKEMQRKRGELTQPILQKIMAIVRNIAMQEGYEMVIEKAVVPYFRADLELTDRAIQLYNSGQGGGAQGAKPPAGAAKPAAPPAKPANPAPKK